MNNKKVWVSEPWKISLIEDDFASSIEHTNEVVIKNLYSHISAGTELACLNGTESFFQIPDVPGYTSIGEVIAKGENVQHIEIGDKVYTYGSHQQYFKIDITDRWHGVCVKLPEEIDPKLAAFTHMAGIAITAIRNARIELGDTVLITGLGAIGNLCAQLAQLQGATVIATDIDDSRIAIAQASNIIHTINTSKSDLQASIRDQTNNHGVDTYIDATGVSALISQTLEYVKTNGDVILLGSPRAPYESNLTDTLQKFHLFPNLQLKGALEFTFPTHQNDFNKHSIERNAAIIMNLIKEKKLWIEPIFSHKLSPSEAQKAYEGLRDKKNEYIGVIFDWSLI